MNSLRAIRFALVACLFILLWAESQADASPILFGLNGSGGVSRYDAVTGASISGWSGSLDSFGSIAFGPNGLLYGLNGSGGVTAYDPITGASAFGWSGQLDSRG